MNKRNIFHINFRFIDTEQRRNYQPGYGWTHYYTVTEIYGWLDDLLEKYPNVLTDFTIGSSFENRTIRAIKLSHKPVKRADFLLKISDKIRNYF